jgi:hypothetical protein
MDGREQRDVVELQCSTVSCGATRKNEQAKAKTKKPKIYLHYSFKDNDYPQLYERFISYRAVNTFSVIKNQSVGAVGGIVDVFSTAARRQE